MHNDFKYREAVQRFYKIFIFAWIFCLLKS